MKIYKIRSKNTGLFSNGLNYCNSSGYYSSFNEFGFDALGKCWASVESLKKHLSKMLKEAPVYIYDTLEIVEYSLIEEFALIYINLEVLYDLRI